MATEDITLQLGIEFRAAQFQKTYKNAFKEMEKASTKAAKSGQGAFGDFVDKVSKRFTKIPKLTKLAEKELKKYNRAQKEGLVNYKNEMKILIKKQVKVKEEIATLKALGDQATDTQRNVVAGAQAEVKAYQASAAAAKKCYEDAKAGAENLQADIEAMKITVNGEEMIKAAVTAGKEFAEPFGQLLRRDVEGAAKTFGKQAGQGIKSIGRGVGGFGAKLTAKAEKMQGSDAHQAGGGNRALAATMKMMGGVFSKMGPIIQTLSTVGPMMGALAGSMVGLVKLFIDAEGAVKEFNKDLLASAGTGQWFGKGMRDARVGLADMDKTLNQFRESAHDIKSNFEWGIGVATHKEVLTSLQAEGVTLTAMVQQYGQLNKVSGVYSKDVGAVTQSVVGYSRSMGVSLQEVTGFQAEMMTEMGAGLEKVKESFDQMSAAAVDAGIASNKFFAMIRGVSSDLALYNTRLDSAVQLLGKLGKVMSPKNAQKFMQFALSAMKGMSLQDKVQLSLMAGPQKVAKLMKEDIAEKTSKLAEDISKAGGGSVKEIQAALEAGPAGEKAMKGFIDAAEKASGKGMGDIREATSKLGMQKQQAGKGMVGTAAASESMDASRKIEMMMAAVDRFGGVGSIGGEVKGQEVFGSMDTYQQGKIMQKTMEDQRKAIVESGQYTKEQAADMSWKQLQGTMSEGQKATIKAAEDEKKRLEDVQKAQDQANKQVGERVQSISEKLEELMKWFMNQLYNLLTGIYAAIMKWAGFSNGVGAAQVEAARSGNTEITKALEGQKSDKDAGIALLRTSMGKDLAGQTVERKQGSFKRDEAEEIERKSIGSGEEEQAKAKAKADALRKEADALDKKQEWVTSQLDAKVTDKQKAADPGDRSKQRGAAWAAMSTEEQTKMLGEFTKAFPTKPLDDMATAATKEGSIYTHDKTVAESVDALGMTGFATYDELVAGSVDALAGAVEALGAGGFDVWVQNWPTSIADQPQVAAPVMGGGGDAIDPTILEDQVEQEEAAVGSLAEIEKVLKFKGVRLNKNMIDTDLKKMTEEATLDAMRVGLLEYAMYKDKKPEELAAMLAGADPKTFGKGLLERAVKPNAAGGMVTGVEGGEAVVAAPGEGLVSIGEGERILPANAAGTMGGTSSAVTVTLELVGDLKQLVRAVAQDEIVRHAAAASTR